MSTTTLSTNDNKKWSIQDATNFINDLREHLAPDYMLGLTGSVLYKGESLNDLDIIIFPSCSLIYDKREIGKLLKSFGMRCFMSSNTLQRRWKKHGHLDEKCVEKHKFGDKLVDVFYLT